MLRYTTLPVLLISVKINVHFSDFLGYIIGDSFNLFCIYVMALIQDRVGDNV
jgi:hypothetical protein